MENLLENSFIVWMNNGYDNYDSFMYDKTKQCKTCGNIYNLNNFRKQKESTDGFGIYCKICLKDKYNKSLLNKEYKIRLAKQRHDNHIKNKDKYNKKHRDNYQANKDKIYEYIKEKRGQDKINSVVSKLENMSMEELAKILIESRKTKLLEV